MKLERKLLTSYLFVILIAIMTSFTLFTVSSNQYLTYRIVEDMQKELQIITIDLQTKDYSKWSVGSQIQNQLMRLVKSNLVIVEHNKVDNTKSVICDNVTIEEMLQADDFDIKQLEKKYIMVNGSVDKGLNHYDIILLSEKGMINSLNRINLSILFITSLVSMLIASFFGIYVQNNISSPIHELKNKVSDFKGNLIAPKRTIFTNDEIQELDEGIVEMAESIVNNDRKRKAFFENTSHELKTPLMNIRGYSEGLKDGIFTIDEASEIISKESETLQKMVEAILYLSKLEDATQSSFEFERIDLNEFLNGFYHKMSTIVAERDLRFILDLDFTVLVEIDEEKMIRALSNIITNASRYAKSEIVIETRIQENAVDIMISNDGPQIATKDFPHIFERFYKGNQGQSGLGLSIVKSIIMAHQGSVEAKNVESGVSMNIRLPYVENLPKSKSMIKKV
ncbi:MAG TPA: sensor histidine kinase [Firmicutes bacterium]|nr:sensor histidine kinase [Bacillota bacterium]